MKKMMYWALVLLRYLIGFVIVVGLYRSHQINFSVLLDINTTTALSVGALCFFQLALSAWRVKWLLAAHHISAGFYRCVLYNAVGVFYSVVLPGGVSGDAVRGYYFWRCKHTVGATKAALFGALVTDRLLGTLSMLFIGLLAATVSQKALGLSNGYLGLLWCAFVGSIGAYLCLCSTHRYAYKKSSPYWIHGILQRIQRILSTLDLKDYPRRTLWFVVLLSIVIHIGSALVIFIFAKQLASGLNFGQVMAVAPVGLLVNALPLSPGGLGVGEKGFDFLFSLIGGCHGGNVFLMSRFFIFSPALLGAVFAFYLWIKTWVMTLYFDSGMKTS